MVANGLTETMLPTRSKKDGPQHTSPNLSVPGSYLTLFRPQRLLNPTSQMARKAK